MDIAGTYGLAHLDASFCLYVSARRFAFRERTGNRTRGKRGSGPGEARRWLGCRGGSGEIVLQLWTMLGEESARTSRPPVMA